MKLVNRTSWLFTLSSAIILFLFAYSVYFFSEINRHEEFVDRLRYKITWRAEFIFDAQLNEYQIRKIHEQNKKLINEAQVTVFDQYNKVVFTDVNEPSYSPEQLNRVKQTNVLTWRDNNELYMGLHYKFQGQPFFLIGHAHDVTGFAHMERLKNILVTIYIAALFFIFFSSFLFARYILKPINYIIHQIKDVSEHNLSRRVSYGKAKDELSELIHTFNNTFNRLEKSFNNQRHFVSIISHEFRTPLASMIAELELAQELNTEVDEYRASIDSALLDAKEATVLSTALLDFARANYDSSQVNFEEIRLDEILLDAKLVVLEKNRDYRISISFDSSVEIDGDEILISGNAYLLKVAFANLIENACKYSADQHAHVLLSRNHHTARVQVKDNGIGIDSQDIPHIFDLFYRVAGTPARDGHGIGLSIVNRIVEMHEGSIAVDSILNVGSCFLFELHLSNLKKEI
ncbi:Signal transduction histidine-protein kinase ArlS [compost metagenome]